MVYMLGMNTGVYTRYIHRCIYLVYTPMYIPRQCITPIYIDQYIHQCIYLTHIYTSVNINTSLSQTFLLMQMTYIQYMHQCIYQYIIRSAFVYIHHVYTGIYPSLYTLYILVYKLVYTPRIIYWYIHYSIYQYIH